MSAPTHESRALQNIVNRLHKRGLGVGLKVWISDVYDALPGVPRETVHAMILANRQTLPLRRMDLGHTDPERMAASEVSYLTATWHAIEADYPGMAAF